MVEDLRRDPDLNPTGMNRKHPVTPVSTGTSPSTRQSRRRFCLNSGLATAAVLAGCRTPQEDRLTGFVDAHVHVWTPDVARYPIHSTFTTADLQPPRFTPEDLFRHSQPSGVRRVVLIQMSFYRFDNRYLLDSLHRFPGVFSGVGVIDEAAPGLAGTVRELARSGVRGFRITPGAQAVESWIGSAGMQNLWRLCADQNLAVCPLINPNALPAIHRMCQRFPRTRVVIDHFARIGVDGQFRSGELDGLCGLAAFPNVYVKTSAFYALGRKQAPYVDLSPLILRVRDAFGARRLMWGSDCPYQVDPGHTYADSVALIRDRLPFLSIEERRWMLRETATQVFFH